ncbi:hypothetical protein HK101_002059 [Irineochytrium annulatum]|nr:hypothetical protein HK101_002059 [Irineochytrium annulatum]
MAVNSKKPLSSSGMPSTSAVVAIVPVVILSLLAALAAPSLAIALPLQSAPSRIVSAKGPLFYDALGRARVLRGTNVVYKGAPWHPDTSPNADPRWSFNQQDVDILASHGVTAVRLGIMWPGVEPVRGQFNQTYLQVMVGIVSMLRDSGIYVLLDFHQDGLSEKFCGEGVPLWAAQPQGSFFNLLGFPVPQQAKAFAVDSNGIPSSSDCSKYSMLQVQMTVGAGSAYERLYKNHDGLRDSFVNYWKQVAQAFLPFDNILGYDLMNEPFAGNAIADPGLLVPGVADKLNLQPFYDAAAQGIRSVDPNAMIFFESVTWDNFAVGFTAVPGGSQYGSKSVLSFHHYEPPQLSGLETTFTERLLDMKRLGCGGMLTEFEMGWQNGGNVPAIIAKSKLAEKYFFSYTGWEYTDYIAITGTNNGLRDPSNGQVRPDMAAVYSRTYATAIAGTPNSMSFDDASGHFTLTFTHDGSDHPTEIRLNSASHYPNGYRVVATASAGGVRCLTQADGAIDGFVYVVKDAAAAGNLAGASVTIEVLSN